ncbi:hypothetical protein CEXT_6481 [Caerostris extrusa]|uniref:Uncharacterized protein n=1 Tax=Caerostris extrusa TaxID=172846 RepID=A0AAV4U4S5_CAEEX|nr:hypothetical protein CEXT_6481 [Caerostris extrusa]
MKTPRTGGAPAAFDGGVSPLFKENNPKEKIGRSGLSATTASLCKEDSCRHLDERISSRHFPVAWPTKSSGCIHTNCRLWSHLKDFVYHDLLVSPSNLQHGHTRALSDCVNSHSGIIGRHAKIFTLEFVAPGTFLSHNFLSHLERQHSNLLAPLYAFNR